MNAQSKHDVAPWQRDLFRVKPTGRKDYWSVVGEWVVRVHACARTQPFIPLHASFSTG